MINEQFTSVLIVCQRTHHQVWMKYLRDIFAPPDDTKIAIECAFNCTPEGTLKHTQRIRRNAEYDKAIIIADINGDTGRLARLERSALEKGVEVFIFPLSHESFLLSILGPSRTYEKDLATTPEQYLHDTYGYTDSLSLYDFYKNHFDAASLEIHKSDNRLLASNLSLIHHT